MCSRCNRQVHAVRVSDHSKPREQNVDRVPRHDSRWDIVVVTLELRFMIDRQVATENGLD